MISVVKRACLVAVGLTTGLLLAEGLLRLAAPEDETYGAAREKVEFRDGGRRIARTYTVDPEVGFRPILGTGSYSAHGTLPNGYPLEKRPRVQRLLFIGDSVTAEGLIVKHLRSLYGEREYEFWNAGVHSFNTTQEVKYYARWNASIRPDHVILTFHNNDFEVTPVAFLDADGKLVVYTPALIMTGPMRWLFRNSRLFRVVVGAITHRDGGKERAVAETRRSLAELQATLARDGIRLSVVLLPLMKPYPTWTAAEKRSRARSLEMFDRLNLRYVDLMPALDAALAATPPDHHDTWHPADGAALRFAEYVRDHDLLTAPAPPVSGAPTR